MTDEIWTVKRVLEWIERYLAQRGDINARVSAQWLVSEALGISRMQLFVDSERPLSEDERAILRDWTRRRASGEPLQYITGEVAFRHITLKISPGVLIPRPETEVLVSEALALLPDAPKPQDEYDERIIQLYTKLTEDRADAGSDINLAALDQENRLWSALPDNGESVKLDNDTNGESDNVTNKEPDIDVSEKPENGADRGIPKAKASHDELLVADLCTGSACIACSIAVEHPLTRVIATDLSPDAVALARENVEALELLDRIEVVECDLGSGIDAALTGRFNLIVSNPPYIPTEIMSELPSEVVEREPRLALDGGADGLDVFRRILQWSKAALAPGGGLAVELHETCLDNAAALARNAGFTDVHITNDLANRPRVLSARMPL